MKILALILCLAVPAFGQDMVLDKTPLLDIRPIQAGDPSPVTGRVIEAQSYILLAQRVKQADIIINDPPVTPPPLGLISLGVGVSLALGVVLGLAIGGIIKK